MLEAPIIGVIPEDDSVKEAIVKKDALVHVKPKSKAARKYHEIASKIVGPDAVKEKKRKGFFDKILDKF
jgi:MinD-like ATPase involved in chromosome partitioning or flagellar assembly